MAKKGVTVGLDKLYYAIMTDETTESYATPKAFPGAIQLNVTPTTNSATLYSDDQASEVADSLGDIQVSLNVEDVPTEIQADLLGHTVDEKGVLVKSKNDYAPYVAIGYRRRKSNGKYRYVWNYKGKFRPGAEEAKTKTDTPEFQTPTIEATFLPRVDNGKWQAVVNEDDEGVDATVISGWFNSVYGVTPTPPTP